MAWESAQQVAKNDKGEFVALIGGKWEPVAQAAKNDKGEFQVLRTAASPAPTPEPEKTSLMQDVASGAGNLLAGAARGAGSIGATILSPIDAAARAAGIENSWIGLDRRKAMDEGLSAIGADPESLLFKTGKFSTELAGTAGVGGVLAKGAQAAGAAPAIVKALETYGMATGAAPKGAGQWLANQGIRTGAGALGGGAASLAVDPEHAGTGAAIGAAAPAVLGPLGYVGGKMWNAGRNLVSGPEGQASNYLAEVFGKNRAKVAQELMKLKSGVTGERPTAGLAAVSGDVPIPALKALEQGARSRGAMAQDFAAIDARNEAARAMPLESIAAVGRRPQVGQGERLLPSRAEATRASITQPMYQKAGKETVVMDDVLDTILGGAEVQGAASRAGVSKQQSVANALAAGKPAPEGIYRGKVTEAYSLPEWGPSPVSPRTVEPSTVTIDALKRFKDQIDADISGLVGSVDAAGKTQLAQLKVARAQLDKWMRGKSPAYGEAQDTFKELSIPQNQAQVAQVLLDALKTPAGVERGTAFGNAYRNAAGTITNKAGVPRFEQLGQVFSPTQKRMVDATKASVDREAQYASLSAPRSILPEMKNTFDAIENNVPGFLNKVVTAARKGLSRAGGELDAESQIVVDKLMTEPKALADFIMKKTPAERDKIAQFMASKINPKTGASVNSVVAAMQGE